MGRRIIRNEAARDRSRLIREALAKKPTAGTFYISGVSKVKALPLGLVESPHSILISGGIGDFLALDSMMRPEERASIHTICYATRQHAPIKQLITKFPSYSNVKNHIVVWDDWSELFCFLFKSEVMDKLGTIPEVLRIATDYGITRKFPEYTRDGRVSSSCSPVMFNIADINKFNLPQSYICVCPYTVNDKRLKERDFTDQDWINLLDYLNRKNLIGVVLNIGDDPIPNHKNLLNFANKTTLEESIEILKRSQGYIGIDSALSVIAAKLFVPPNILVKSQNQHLKEWQHIYYSPLREFSFIEPNMDSLGSSSTAIRSRYNNRKIRPKG